MKKNILLIQAIIIILLVFMVLVSCGETEGSTAVETEQSETTSIETDTFIDSIPEGLNFSGDTYTVLCRSAKSRFGDIWADEILVDTGNGEILNDTIYKRKIDIEDRFNVKLEKIMIDGDWDDQNIFINYVQNSVLANDSLFELIAGYTAYIAALPLRGLCIDLLTLPHVSFDSDWWINDGLDNINIGGKFYLASGFIGLTSMAAVNGIFFNHKLAEEYCDTNLYELIDRGSWTLDEMRIICSKVYSDLNGNGEEDYEDLYAMSTQDRDGWILSSGIKIIQNDADGYPQLTIYSEKLVNLYVKIYDLLYNTKSIYPTYKAYSEYSKVGSSDVLAFLNQMFVNDRMLFHPECMNETENLRGMTSDYGIIPYPKFDESQNRYLSPSYDWYSLYSVPKTNTKLEMTGAVMEALAAEGYRTLKPVYYETLLKDKYLRDEISGRMLDMIFDGVVFDIGVVYSGQLNWVYQIFGGLASNPPSPDIASVYASKEASFKAGLETVINTFKELE